MRSATVLICLCILGGCARSAVSYLELTGDAGPAGGGSPRDDGGQGKDGQAQPPGTDGGAPQTVEDAGSEDGGAVQCNDPALTCEGATSVGTLDASDSSSMVTQQGKGSAWLAVDFNDGNVNDMGNSRIGVGVTLTAPAGSSYAVTLVGDTGPNMGGRCIAADVTATDPLKKTAIWGSFGPTQASVRTLAVHVEHLSGPCDENWTLTIKGNPCGSLTFGFGEDSLGSCP